MVQVLHAPHPKLLGLLLGLGEHYSCRVTDSSEITTVGLHNDDETQNNTIPASIDIKDR